MESSEKLNSLSAVYVPIDESEASRGAVPLARTMARISGASLHLVHTSEQTGETPGELKSRLHLRRDEMENAVLEQVQGKRTGESLTEKAGQRPHSAIVMSMYSPEETGGSRPEDGLGVGAKRILESAICPVLLVPPESRWEHWKPAKMLLPQDSTAEMAAAVRPAVAVAEQNSASLIVLHVPSYSRRSLDSTEAALPFPRYMDQPQHEFPAWKQEFVERFRELGHIPQDLNVELFLGLGEPADEILNWATRLQVDLIVIPWSGSFERAATLRKVFRSSECPIMAIPVKRR